MEHSLKLVKMVVTASCVSHELLRICFVLFCFAVTRKEERRFDDVLAGLKKIS